MTQPPPPKEPLTRIEKLTVIGILIAAAAIFAQPEVSAWISDQRASGTGSAAPPAAPVTASAEPLTAKDVLKMTSPNPNGLNIIGADQLTVPINGDINKPIPTGEVVWAAFRKPEDSADDGRSLQRLGMFFIAACTVDQAGGKFDCGSPQFGPDIPQAGSYYVYVGLADANAEKQLVQIQTEQNAATPVWSHAAPPGLDLAQKAIVQRPAK